MAGKKGYILVEGYGEVSAVPNLVTRLSKAMGVSMPWTEPRRLPNIHQWEARISGGVKAGAELIRTKAEAGALLIIRDSDDHCPKTLAPEMSAKLRAGGRCALRWQPRPCNSLLVSLLWRNWMGIPGIRINNSLDFSAHRLTEPGDVEGGFLTCQE